MNTSRICKDIRSSKPVVLCLTNTVTMEFVANTLLAIKASPIMINDVNELSDLLSISAVLYINIGTIDQQFIALARAAVTRASEKNVPIILDPVGAGASRVRTEFARELLSYASIVRGNASEILALEQARILTDSKGVESTDRTQDVAHYAIALARRFSTTVIVSGATDFITDGRRQTYNTHGSALMSHVTGMGCAMTAVVAAFRAVCADSFHASEQAATYFSICGAQAAISADGPATMQLKLLDCLYRNEANCVEATC